jgi:hypothetical protein
VVVATNQQNQDYFVGPPRNRRSAAAASAMSPNSALSVPGALPTALQPQPPSSLPSYFAPDPSVHARKSRFPPPAGGAATLVVPLALMP